MIVAESRRGRRLVGRLDKGTDLVEGLAEVCRARSVRAGEVRAIGALDQVVLSEFDQRARVYRPGRRFDAQFEILSLNGNLSEKDGKLFVQLHTSLSRERDNGIELIGGRLMSGRVFFVEFVIEVFDDVILRRSPDAATGLQLWREAIALEPPSEAAVAAGETRASPPPFEAPARLVAMPHAQAAPSWQEVAAASEEREQVALESAPEPSAPGEEVKVSPGDWIDHPKFGRCQVERIEGDYEFVSARMRNQRLIRLSLDVLTFVPAGEEGDHRVFRAVPGRR